MRTKDIDKQQRIKDAMISLILKEGINGASVAKIAREANVSPATIYVYYRNKDDMLSEVFGEYVEKCYSYLCKRIYPQMSGPDLIDALIRGTYAYSLENREIFSFVEQCFACPTIQEDIVHSAHYADVFDLIHEYQRKGVIRSYSDSNISAVLFAPVKFMVMNRSMFPDPEKDLDELVMMLKDMLLY